MTGIQQRLYAKVVQNGSSDHLPPVLVDHLPVLAINKQRWSGYPAKAGEFERFIT